MRARGGAGSIMAEVHRTLKHLDAETMVHELKFAPHEHQSPTDFLATIYKTPQAKPPAWALMPVKENRGKHGPGINWAGVTQGATPRKMRGIEADQQIAAGLKKPRTPVVKPTCGSCGALGHKTNRSKQCKNPPHKDAIGGLLGGTGAVGAVNII